MRGRGGATTRDALAHLARAQGLGMTYGNYTSVLLDRGSISEKGPAERAGPSG